jgi:hypothetical protein
MSPRNDFWFDPMLPDSLTPFAARALAHYPHLDLSSFASLGSAGGFSGASLWKAVAKTATWCLKAWPSSGPSRERLARIHHWMTQARAAGLSFVPALARTMDGSTIVEQDDRLWDLSEWMPGRADFRENRSVARIQMMSEPPSTQRRLRAATEWLDLVSSGWGPLFPGPAVDPVTEIARIAWDILPRLVPTVRPMLAPWIGRPLPLHPCLCDIWHDHLLFTGDDVTGIVDYGSMRLDHPAADLARLLGDLVGRDESLYAAGLDAYRRLRSLSAEDTALVRTLDRTGTILAASNWLLRLYRDDRPCGERSHIVERLRTIVERLSDPGEIASGRLC